MDMSFGYRDVAILLQSWKVCTTLVVVPNPTTEASVTTSFITSLDPS